MVKLWHIKEKKGKRGRISSLRETLSPGTSLGFCAPRHSTWHSLSGSCLLETTVNPMRLSCVILVIPVEDVGKPDQTANGVE